MTRTIELSANVTSLSSLKTIFGCLDDIVIILDKERRISGLNNKAKKYYSCKKTKGLSYEEFCKINNREIVFSFTTSENLGTTVAIKKISINTHKNYTIRWSLIRINHNNIEIGFVIIGKLLINQVILNRVNKQISNYLEQISSCMPGNFYWKNKAGRYLNCNNSLLKTLGFSSKKKIINKTDYDLWPNEAKKLRMNDEEVMRSGRVHFFEETVEMDGEVKYFTVVKMPLLDENGNVDGIIGNSLEITELKETQHELIRAKEKADIASQTKSEFIANMSHDIRTPITGILGLIEELIDIADNTLVSLQQDSSTKAKTTGNYLSLINRLAEAVREDGQLILGSADELLQLLNEILETMRLESGKAPEKAESFNLRELVEHNIELMQPIARHKKLKLSWEIDDWVPLYFSGLRHYLDRSLLNLLSNALKFTDKGFVKIKVQMLVKSHSTYCLGDKVELNISIQDSGIGIPEDKFETIFEHFSRLTSSYQGIYKGSGLGLYTVKSYIEAMQAAISVESEAGKGTCFIIKLPLTVSDHSDREKTSYRMPATIQPKPAVKEEKAKEVVKAEATTRILIVEDNHIAAKSVQSTITRLYSYTACDWAENGMQAVKMAEENQYDFILMDIGLPDINGIEVTKQIRAFNNQQRAKVPIVALTGHSDDWEGKEEALAAGMQDVFSKPLTSFVFESLMQRFVFSPEEETLALAEETESPIPDSLIASIIDWPQCLKQFNGDEECVRELLSGLAIDLKMSQEQLAKSYASHDEEALRAELHRVRGGVAYLSLPQLDKALAEFHDAVKAKPQVPEQMEKSYVCLQHALNTFWETLEKDDLFAEPYVNKTEGSRQES